MDVGSPEWKRFMMEQIVMKAEWFPFYGEHVEFEAMDDKREFGAMMERLADAPRREYLLFHMAMTRPSWSWEIEKHRPFLYAHGAQYLGALKAAGRGLLNK